MSSFEALVWAQPILEMYSRRALLHAFARETRRKRRTNVDFWFVVWEGE
jgi:hypothetical protein